MNKVAILEYNFIFTPSTKTWTNLYQFEQQLAKYFSMCNLEAEIVKSVEGGSSKRFMHIKEKETIVNEPKPIVKATAMKAHFDKMRTKKITASERNFRQTRKLKVIKK